MSSENENVLLWGIWFEPVEEETEGWWWGDHNEGVMTWDVKTRQAGASEAARLGGKLKPYLTLADVVTEFSRAMTESLKQAPSGVKVAMETLFNLAQLGGHREKVGKTGG